MIGRQFLFMGLFMLLIGGLLAMLVRWELAWPETAGAWASASFQSLICMPVNMAAALFRRKLTTRSSPCTRRS